MNSSFDISKLPTSLVKDVTAIWDQIDFEPTYQRQSDIWGIEKQQLFIDSLINGFDIPKLYFHDVSWDPQAATKRYAIIDGKQRLQAIRKFANGEIALSSDFEDLRSSTGTTAANLRLPELIGELSVLRSRFENAELPIVLVQTEDDELIDEMFSRLNEAVPLNAPEKRNAYGGPLPRQIRRLVLLGFFKQRMAFPNSRYRHLDLATKFLYIEHRDGLVDLKKRDLDQFVRDFKEGARSKVASDLYRKASTTLRLMSAVFVPSDPLLASVGMVTIYYQLVRESFRDGWYAEIDRSRLVEFDDLRAQNRGLVKEAQELALEGHPERAPTNINPVLSQFERYVQSPNDARALNDRLRVLKGFVRTSGESVR